MSGRILPFAFLIIRSFRVSLAGLGRLICKLCSNLSMSFTSFWLLVDRNSMNGKREGCAPLNEASNLAKVLSAKLFVRSAIPKTLSSI